MKILVHDINNNITAISLLIHKLRKNDTLDDDALHIIDKIKKQTDNISKICANVTTREFKILDIGDAIKNIVSDNCFSTKVVVHKNASVKHMIDKCAISQMVNNILKNSYEANANRVDVFIEPDHIEFKDNGHGITNKQLKNMLSSNSLSTKGDDRGIGLKSIKKCCSDHKFTLHIQPNEFGLSLFIKF